MTSKGPLASGMDGHSSIDCHLPTIKPMLQKVGLSQEPVAYTCNPSYVAGKNQGSGSRLALANSL
jgi:hypothetical protein